MRDMGTQNYWTPKRLELLSWFRRYAPSLGELYEGAVIMVFSEKFPGRVRFVAHAVREIRNRLPNVIAGFKGGGPLQYKNRLDEIEDVWKKHGLPLDGSSPTRITDIELLPPGYVVIPSQVYKKIAKLVKDHVQTRETPREAAKRLFQAIDPKNQALEATIRPRIEHLINCTEWFVELVHDSGKIDERKDEELKRRFEVFEASLSAMIREFFKTVEELDAILEEANS